MVYVLFVLLFSLPNTFFLASVFLLELVMLFWSCYLQDLGHCQISTDAESMQKSQLMDPVNVPCGYWIGKSEIEVWQYFGGQMGRN